MTELSQISLYGHNIYGKMGSYNNKYKFHYHISNSTSTMKKKMCVDTNICINKFIFWRSSPIINISGKVPVNLSLTVSQGNVKCQKQIQKFVTLKYPVFSNARQIGLPIWLERDLDTEHASNEPIL